MISLPTSRCSRSRSLIISFAMFGSPPVRCARRLHRAAPSTGRSAATCRASPASGGSTGSSFLPSSFASFDRALRGRDRRRRRCHRCGPGRRGRRRGRRAASRSDPGTRSPTAPRPAGTEAGALGHERRVRDGPTVVEAADHVVVVHARVVDEHLVEHRAAGHLPQRTDLDARLRHVELEVRDALVLRQVRDRCARSACRGCTAARSRSTPSGR